MKDLSLGLLVSGSLGLICLKHVYLNRRLNFIFTDYASESIIVFARDNHIPVFIGNPRNGRSREFLSNKSVELILSINYIFVVDRDVIEFPLKYAVNFHGSLLPKYRGRTPHVWAIINNESKSGITAHLISENCDEGDILYQEIVEIDQNETGGDLLIKFQNRYPWIIDHIINLIEDNLVVLVPQVHECASYFGKRTEKDGLINWDWQKERIFNWVRAQSKPYPGAYTYLKNQKVIIHKIQYSNLGYSNNDPNGMILNTQGNMIVKTPNGAVEISEIETQSTLNFIKGDIFHG